MKKVIKKTLEKLGFRIIKISNNTEVKLEAKEITDLDKLVNISSFIPSMLSPESGKFLYTLCYMQKIQGDVVEVGSWQGYSTSFLARAVRNSGNGKLYAIDHFQGNIGKESFYVVGNKNLNDLKDNFQRNMQKIGLWNYVNLLDMPNDLATEKLKEKRIRFLFIDGDHTKKGVEKDINLFFPLLKPGSIIVFDDFSNNTPGLVEAIDNLLKTRKFERVFSYNNTIVMMM